MHNVRYQVRNVTSLIDLIDIMRYDQMTFDSDPGVWRSLEERDLGQVNPEFRPLTLHLQKLQFRGWEPTYDRWRSFSMFIEREN